MFGGETKSLSGTGIFLTMYSQTTSMLYLSCADIGTTGAPSATVRCSRTMKSCYRLLICKTHNKDYNQTGQLSRKSMKNDIYNDSYWFTSNNTFLTILFIYFVHFLV
jgi:hypothetical protein